MRVPGMFDIFLCMRRKIKADFRGRLPGLVKPDQPSDFSWQDF